MSTQPPGLGPPGREPRALERAIQATKATIERRAALHRNLVIAVVVCGLLAATASLALWSWRPLCALILLVPLCGVFWTTDIRLVGRWRAGVLEQWQREGLRLTALVAALSSLSLIPPRTLAGMLTALGGGHEPSGLDRLSVAEKAELTRRLPSHARRDIAYLWCGTAAATCVLACAAATVVRPGPGVLVGLGAALLLGLLCRRRCGRSG